MLTAATETRESSSLKTRIITYLVTSRVAVDRIVITMRSEATAVIRDDLLSSVSNSRGSNIMGTVIPFFGLLDAWLWQLVM